MLKKLFFEIINGTHPYFLFGLINDTYVYIQGSPHMEKGSPTWSAPIKRGEAPSKGGGRRPHREGEGGANMMSGPGRHMS